MNNKIDTAETYNLGVVVNETGINPDTLRAWERRYGLPDPGRTEGGHRLYSRHDIDLVHWLLERQEEGMRISRAVELWETLVEAGRDPLREKPLKTRDQLSRPMAAPDMDQAISLREIRQKWIKASLNFNEFAAEQILTQAAAVYPLEMVMVEVLQKGLSQVGLMWQHNQITPHQEHFTSSLAIRRVDALITASPPPSQPETILVASPPREEHVFSSLLVTLIMRRRGYNVVYLGANLPLEKFQESIEVIQPELVVLSAMRLETAATLLEMSAYLAEKRILTAYGGWIFTQLPELIERIPAHYLGDDFKHVARKIEELLSSGRPPQLESAGEDYHVFLDHLRHREMRVLDAVQEAAGEHSIPVEFLATANQYFTRSLKAALALGSPAFLDHEMTWLQSLLEGRGYSSNLLRQYLAVFSRKLGDVTGEDYPVALKQWFEKYI